MRLIGSVFRAHNPRWSYAPTSGEGAAQFGGRFNPVGMSALYTSTSPESAWREAQKGFPFKAQPLTICGYDVDCTDVLDLTDPVTRAEWAISEQDLACPWRDLLSRGSVPPSWTIARRLHAEGVAAVIVPAFVIGAAPGDCNVVFWRWGDPLPHRVRVVDDERRLPLDARSWT